MNNFNTPVLLMVFNRPRTTKRVFEAIRKIKPARLYIAADGARNDAAGEKEIVESVREIVDIGIDWPCDVKKLYRKKNIGCGKAISEAISWFFENENKGIILEDDTLPESDFFRFCEDLLNKYENDERIMHISGCTFLPQSMTPKDSYYYSELPFIWGWATWKRSWKHYSYSFDFEPSFNFDTFLRKKLTSKKKYNYWKKPVIDILSGKMDTWDFQWTLTCWWKNGICIVPAKNLVKNIGFGEQGTHTNGSEAITQTQITENLHWPLSDPAEIKLNKTADDYIHNTYFNASIWKRIYSKLKTW